MKAVFLETLHVCFLMFRRTVRTLVAIREPAFLKEDLPGQLLTTYLHGRFRSAIESEARPGLTMDPRVVEYFAAELPLGRVLEHMGAHFAPFSLEDLFG